MTRFPLSIRHKKMNDSMRSGITVGFLSIFLCLSGFFAGETEAARPFWTKKPAYIEGNYLYVLGAVSNMPSIEKGKQQALVHGKLELMNVAQISEVGTEGLTLETRHTYVEKNPDGSINIYQLFRIPAANVIQAQQLLHTQRQAQSRSFADSQKKLTALHESLRQSQQTAHAQLDSVERALQEISKAHEQYLARSKALDEQQAEIETLQKTLQKKFSLIDTSIDRIDGQLSQFREKSHAQDVLLSELEGMEKSLEEKEMKVRQLQQAILKRVTHASNMACQSISQGMTPNDVKKILGTPYGEKHSYSNERYDTWAYGKTKIHFDSQGVVESVTGCDSSLLPRDDPPSSQ